MKTMWHELSSRITTAVAINSNTVTRWFYPWYVYIYSFFACIMLHLDFMIALHWMEEGGIFMTLHLS